MRKKGWIGALCALLCCAQLAGCGLLEREYRVTKEHSDRYWESESADILRAESYDDVVSDLLILIGRHTESATLRLYQFTDDAAAAETLEQAALEVQQETAMGAYAVEYITYTIDDSARNYTAIHLTIGYRRTQEQIASMVYTTSVSALRELLTAAARSGSPELVVQVGYFDHQEDQVRSIVDQVQAIEAPEHKEPWTVNFYPEGGDVGII